MREPSRVGWPAVWCAAAALYETYGAARFKEIATTAVADPQRTTPTAAELGGCWERGDSVANTAHEIQPCLVLHTLV